MADHDRAAVHIHLVTVEHKLLNDRDVQRRERLLEFGEIELVDARLGAFERLPYRRDTGRCDRPACAPSQDDGVAHVGIKMSACCAARALVINRARPRPMTR